MWWNQDDGTHIAYSQIQGHLVGVQTVDVIIYTRGSMRKTSNGNNGLMDRCHQCCFHCRTPLSNHNEMDLARPIELASVPLGTWSTLATRIKEHRNCKFMGQRWVKVLWWIIFVGFVVMFWRFLIYPLARLAYFSIYLHYGVRFTHLWLIAWISNWIRYILVLVATYIVSNHLEQKHIHEVFLPSVRNVLAEIGDPLAVAGYEVQLLHSVKDSSNCAMRCRKEETWFLRFTLLPNDEERRFRMGLADGATTPATTPFEVPSTTADPALPATEMVEV